MYEAELHYRLSSERRRAVRGERWVRARAGGGVADGVAVLLLNVAIIGPVDLVMFVHRTSFFFIFNVPMYVCMFV